jgi:arabinogalactan endo-1,4-beta-galactosidase
MKKIFYFLLILIIASCSKESTINTIEQDNFIRAADMSYLPLIESENTIYYNSNNQPENALLTLKNAGCNTIRIRLWKNP